MPQCAGSIYHHFPGGNSDLGAEAAWTDENLREATAEGLTEWPSKLTEWFVDAAFGQSTGRDLASVT